METFCIICQRWIRLHHMPTSRRRRHWCLACSNADHTKKLNQKLRGITYAKRVLFTLGRTNSSSNQMDTQEDANTTTSREPPTSQTMNST